MEAESAGECEGRVDEVGAGESGGIRDGEAALGDDGGEGGGRGHMLRNCTDWALCGWRARVLRNASAWLVLRSMTQRKRWCWDLYTQSRHTSKHARSVGIDFKASI